MPMHRLHTALKLFSYKGAQDGNPPPPLAIMNFCFMSRIPCGVEGREKMMEAAAAVEQSYGCVRAQLFQPWITAHLQTAD